MKHNTFARIRIPTLLLLALCLAIAAMIVYPLVRPAKSFLALLRENKALRQNIANLTQESQIGYAKVLSQQTRDGRLYTRLLFVETDRADPLRRVLEKEFEIEGDIVHFDALVVTFDPALVMDGRARSLYLWRRIYGETMSPEQGIPIETPEQEPARYADLCKTLSLPDQKLFWEEIWRLSNNPAALQSIGVKAIYGNVVYRKLTPGLIYIFKISATGTLYPEIIPDL